MLALSLEDCEGMAGSGQAPFGLVVITGQDERISN
jgi:hypothetical protein